MSELVGLCFDADASPSIRFDPPLATAAGQQGFGEFLQGAGETFGWGVGWYPGSDRGASVVKDPTSSGDAGVGPVLADWHRFRSTLFVAHLRGHRRPRKQEDAQPFVRSYGGRQWIFAHDGDLAADWAQRFPLADDPAFDPLGATDSEQAFCLLLSRMHAARYRSLAEVPPDALHGWMRELNDGGQLNAILTDGEHMAVYHDAFRPGELHWTRRIPPHGRTEISAPGIVITHDAPEDPNRTVLVFASAPMSLDPWQALSPGELLLARRGSILWSSEPTVPSAFVPIANSGDPWPVTASQVECSAQPVASAAAFFDPDQPAAPAPVAADRCLLRIVHETLYEYDQPVERSSHRLLLRPLDDRSQRVLDHRIIVEPGVPRASFEDVFGNAATVLEIDRPYDRLSIKSETTVAIDRIPSLESRAGRNPLVLPLTWMPWQRQMLSAYLLPQELPESQLHELTAFANGFVERNDRDLVGTLLDMNETLYRDFEYVSGSTTNATTPFEVYESRRGVCQDFANLMICLARLLQIPARYRMGYIHTGADYANKVQSDASHAWVETYVPQVGWQGFDPTNGVQTNLDHVRVACGRQFRDATPTSGTIYRGGGTETLSIAVRVERIEPDSGGSQS